jgi:protein-tyrosine phosphatase
LGFVDLHCHVLPGLDDGARAMDDSLAMLRLQREIGFDLVCATPHQKFGSLMPPLSAIDAAYADVRKALPDGSVTLHLGAENMWDEVFLERSIARKIPSYTGDNAFLFELPVQQMPPGLEQHLFVLHRAGRLPVMAHPERYTGLWEDPDRVETLRRQAALVIDLGALDGAHGTKQCKMARWMVDEGLCHAAATDCHQPSDLRAAGAGIAWIRKRLGESGVKRLLVEGPRQILNGDLPE